MRLFRLVETFPLRPCIFPAVRGVILDGAQPVARATICRTWEWTWGAKSGRDSTVSGADGSFTLPAVRRWMIFGAVLPHEPVIGQKIEIVRETRVWTAWLTTSHSYDADGGLGRPLALTCRLDSEPRRRQLDQFDIRSVHGIADIEGFP